MAQIGVANRSAKAGITLSCAISLGQAAPCSCCERGLLLVVPGDCRLDRCTARRFWAKLFTHANSHCFTHAGLCSRSQPNSYRDPEGADPH